MPLEVDKARVMDALKEVIDPEIGINIVDLNMVRSVDIKGSKVNVLIALTVSGCPLAHTISSDIEKVLTKFPEVKQVNVETTSMTTEELDQLKTKLHGRIQQQSMPGMTGTPGGIDRLDKGGIRNIIAVVSGKGGVGKSFVTSLMAVELRRQGYEVGILDADIPGPSIPKIFGLTQRPQMGAKGVLPVETKSGIKVISINLLLDDPQKAAIWRGPIINSVIRQLYMEVEWGDLHYLLVDLPPGTSDAPLTVYQSIPLDGSILVATPQDLAVMIVGKAVNMAKSMNVPLLGLIENMAFMNCPDCGKKIEPFGPSKAEKTAQMFSVPLLGTIPIDPEISKASDEGRIEEYAHPAFTEAATNLRLIMSKMVQQSELSPIAWKGKA